MNIRRSAMAFGATFTLAIAAIGLGAPAAEATTLSQGCASVAAGNFDGQYTAVHSTEEIFAGARIVVNASDPRTGLSPATTFSIVMDGTLVRRTEFPGTLDYTFLDDINQVTWTADFSDNVTWTLNCSYVGLPVPILMWNQAVGRASSDAKCNDGWNPSWQEWAIASTGGWVCARAVPMYGQ